MKFVTWSISNIYDVYSCTKSSPIERMSCTEEAEDGRMHETLNFVQPAWRCSGLGANIQKARNGVVHGCSKRQLHQPGYVACVSVVTMPL